MRPFAGTGAALEWLWLQALGLVGPESRLWPVYLLSMLVLAWIVWRARRPGGSFWAFVFPKEVYLHSSTLLDLKLFALGKALSALGMFNAVLLASLSALAMSDLLSGASTGLALPPIAMALAVLVVTDFGVYWVHRLHHEAPILWPFHSLHHSAEVMTPITVYRKHPIYDLIAAIVRGVFLGGLQGALVALFAGELSLATLMGINAGYALFNLAGSNLRHSHIWVSFGPVLERVFISPAQHQIHHSRDPRHYNKNYGEVLAIWDWAFGTLYVPTRREALSFGLSDEFGAPLRQRHDSLRHAIWVPFVDAGRVLRRRMRRGDKARVTPAE